MQFDERNSIQMKHLKVLAVLGLALALCVPAFAETQTVKVSGSLDAYWIYRHNLDLRDNNDAGAYPEGETVAAVDSPDDDGINNSEGDSFFMSIAQVEVAADLTDNVSVVINLLNQRDWNSRAFEDSVNGNEPDRGDENDENEFDVLVDLAYVQMKEIFYAPLTLTIGRQDLWFGRGNIIGANRQDPDNAISANELTAITSFDAVRATLDFEPWTIDVVYSLIDENSTNAEDDHEFWFTNINYQFAEYNAEWELYWMTDIDKGALATTTGAALTVDSPRTDPDNLTHTLGTRAQFDPIQQITLGGEIATQFGDYYLTGGAAEQDRSAWFFELFGEYRWDNTWKPMLGLQYVFFSGDAGTASTDDYEAWNGLFRGPVFGDIRDWQEVFYETADGSDQPAGTNQEHFAIYGAISPLEDLKIDAKFYWFWNEEDIVVSGVSRDEEIGHELDVNVTYDYTEDVSFGLALAWYMPGDFYVADATDGETDADAFQSVSSVKVAF